MLSLIFYICISMLLPNYMTEQHACMGLSWWRHGSQYLNLDEYSERGIVFASWTVPDDAPTRLSEVRDIRALLFANFQLSENIWTIKIPT